jgi:hypothetical protein
LPSNETRLHRGQIRFMVPRAFYFANKKGRLPDVYGFAGKPAII